MVKDRNGQLLTKEDEVNKRWAEHFEDLLNFNDGTEATVTPVILGGGAPRIDRENKESVNVSGLIPGSLPHLRETLS